MNLSANFNFEVRTDPTIKPSFATGILRGKHIQRQLHLVDSLERHAIVAVLYGFGGGKNNFEN